MELIGIICEYNPFHNGHLYHLNKIKELYPDSLIICVISGNTTERGDLSIINKWDKTRIALEAGIDLVIELPFKYASGSADLFCYGSMKLLNYMGVKTIIFGSESNDVASLEKCAKIQLDNDDYNQLVQQYLSTGLNYPTSLAKALYDITGLSINTPNDILAIGYIREIIDNNYDIKPVSILRTSDYNSKELSTICSSSAIRTAIKDGKDIAEYVPSYVLPYINNIDLEDYYDLIKYKLISEKDNLNIYQEMDDKIIPRINKYIDSSHSLDELIKKVKTKNYTYNKLKRLFLYVLFNYTKDRHCSFNDEYIRILGFNKHGRKYLNNIKKNIDIPIITKYIDMYLNQEQINNSILNLKHKQIEEHKQSIIIKE